MKRNNMKKTALIMLLFVIIVFLVFIIYKYLFLYGSGVIEGRTIDKEYQRDQMRNYYMTGHLIEVSNNNIKIQLDTLIPLKASFPHEYIPPYQIIVNKRESFLLINTDRIIINGAANGMFFRKEIGTDSFYIGKDKYPLFDK